MENTVMKTTVTETTLNSDAVNSAIKLRALTEEAFSVVKRLKVLNVKIESLLDSIKVPDSSAPTSREMVLRFLSDAKVNAHILSNEFHYISNGFSNIESQFLQEF